MKPSERIQELCTQVCVENGTESPTTEQLSMARIEALVRYLDEQAPVPEVSETPGQ